MHLAVLNSCKSNLKCSTNNTLKLKLSFLNFAGEGPDGTKYKTAYRCENTHLSISCHDDEEDGDESTIRVIRANYGRFSIAICNPHGFTDWSVNCMAPKTTKILKNRWVDDTDTLLHTCTYSTSSGMSFFLLSPLLRTIY